MKGESRRFKTAFLLTQKTWEKLRIFAVQKSKKLVKVLPGPLFIFYFYAPVVQWLRYGLAMSFLGKTFEKGRSTRKGCDPSSNLCWRIFSKRISLSLLHITKF